jgi:hypothetical protein
MRKAKPMIYELRIYQSVPGQLPSLLSRFQNQTLQLWEKHGREAHLPKLKLGPVETDKPVRVTIKLAAPVYRTLFAYAEALATTTEQEPLKPDKLIRAMIEHFMATDRGFAKLRKQSPLQDSQKVP